MRNSAILILTTLTFGCYKNPSSVLQRMFEARQLATSLHVHFTQVGEATNLAVMAGTDDASAAFAREAEQKLQLVQQDMSALASILENLRFTKETHLLEQFNKQFADYGSIDRSILQLSVQNTNLKAQQLSFGPAAAAADSFCATLEKVAREVPPANAWQARATSGAVIANLRHIQALEAPHIAETSDAVMTQLEARMAADEASVKEGLAGLDSLAFASRSQLVGAEASLTKFLDLHKQIIALSRRNSNVRSLELSLGRKRRVGAQCEDTLRALEEAIGKRGFVATR